MAVDYAPYNGNFVANSFIKTAHYDGQTITHWKLQKIVYIAHCSYLTYNHYTSGSYTGLTSSRIEAWKYGPIIPDIYHAFKKFGNAPISKYHKTYSAYGCDTIRTVSDHDMKFISEIWKQYGKYTALELACMTSTNAENPTPYERAKLRNDINPKLHPLLIACGIDMRDNHSGDDDYNPMITDNDIIEHYKSIM